MSAVGFQMWEPTRQNLMAEHRFYVDQARKRLLSQFENIGTEADKAADEHLEKMSIHFNPDVHDSSAYEEAAYDKGIEHYQLLSDMHETTRLSVIAGMFYQWDKNLRDWFVREMHHWHHGENATKFIRKADVPMIMDILAAFRFNVKELPSYGRLDAMRLVVNVFKHGNGPSLNELQKEFPEFVPRALGNDRQYEFSRYQLTHTNMKVSDAHLAQFSEAVLDFWKAVPKAIFLPDNLNSPKKFEEALLKDSAIKLSPP